jgi:hypothetical protein
MLMRDHEESPSRMYDNLKDLDDPTEADYNMVSGFPRTEVVIEIESMSLGPKVRFKNKS